jgi:release factor glutamine methyltransferase
LFEHGHDQAEGCRRLLEQAGFVDLVAERDLAGILRVSGGRWLTAGSTAG